MYLKGYQGPVLPESLAIAGVDPLLRRCEGKAQLRSGIIAGVAERLMQQDIVYADVMRAEF